MKFLYDVCIRLIIITYILLIAHCNICVLLPCCSFNFVCQRHVLFYPFCVTIGNHVVLSASNSRLDSASTWGGEIVKRFHFLLFEVLPVFQVYKIIMWHRESTFAFLYSVKMNYKNVWKYIFQRVHSKQHFHRNGTINPGQTLKIRMGSFHETPKQLFNFVCLQPFGG